MSRLYRILVGFYRITFSSPRPQRILEMLLKRNIPVFDIRVGEKTVSFCLLSYHWKHLKAFSVLNEESLVKTACGSMAAYQRFGKRWGLAAGLLLSATVLIFSTFFVWSVEVKGNEEFSDAQIRALLSEEGLRPGVFIRSLNPASFALMFQVRNPQFSFSSLNLVGTHAVFTVREKEKVEKPEEKSDTPTNLVASVSGEIVRFETTSGQVRIKQGQIVPQGALLISGVRERKNGSFAVCHAEGKVFAKTTRFFETNIPYEFSETVWSGKEEVEREYEFLWFRFALPPFSEPEFEDRTVVENEENLTLFGKELPVLCRTRTYCEREKKNALLTVDTAKKKAYDIYEEYKRETFASGYEILEEKTEILEGEDTLTLKIEVVAIENIAAEKPFSFSSF